MSRRGGRPGQVAVRGMDSGAGSIARISRVLTLFQNPPAVKSRLKEKLMNPMFIIAVPLVLVFAGMVWNSIGLSYDQPPSSPEPDLAKRAAAEGDAYRRFFDTKRKQSMTRQKRIGQYAWLLVVAFIGSFIWLYNYTVNKTTAATQIATLQTLAMEEGKRVGPFGHAQGRQQREIPDQSAHSRSFGRCDERRRF